MKGEYPVWIAEGMKPHAGENDFALRKVKQSIHLWEYSQEGGHVIANGSAFFHQVLCNYQ